MVARRTKKIHPEVLIRSLIEYAHETGGRPLEQRMADLTVWFYRNKTQIDPMNLQKRQQLLEDGFWIMLEVFALLVERQNDNEFAKRSKALWLPNGLKVEGDLVSNVD